MSQLKFIVLLLCCMLIGLGKCESENVKDNLYKTVTTKSGPVRGLMKVTLLQQKNYYSFRGIPYAKKPIGELRFKVPQPIDRWNDTMDVFEYGNSCTQYPLVYIDKNMQLSEDCLFLNIFVPAEIEPTAKLAVIFYIYGGGFRAGSGDDVLHGPDFLVDNNVVLVTVNYRVHIFGFLSLNTVEYSGNMGFKDQQLALKWIHDNIGYFNGDKNQITMAGHSGGAMSANFHVFNNVSNKLFKNIICLSGTAHVFNIFASKSDNLDEMYNIARNFSYPVESLQGLIEFLKFVPADKLLNITADLRRVTFAPPSYGPIIERRDAIQPFLVETPDEMYNNAVNINITSLFTFANNEHIDFLKPEELTPSNIQHFVDNINLSIPFQGYDKPLILAACPTLRKKIRDFYFGKTETHHDRLLGYTQLYSDVTLIYSIDKTVRIHGEKSNRKTFFWRFAVDSNIKAPKNVHVQGLGAGHSDELCHAFRCRIIAPLYTNVLNTSNNDTGSQISLQTIYTVTKLLTNFAKFGTPIINEDDHSVAGLLPIENGNIHYLDITNDGVFRKQSLNEISFNFWRNIFAEAITTCMLNVTSEE